MLTVRASRSIAATAAKASVTGAPMDWAATMWEFLPPARKYLVGSVLITRIIAVDYE